MAVSSHAPERWFDESSAAATVESLEAEIAQIDSEVRAGRFTPERGDQTQKMVWGVMIIALGFLLILVVALALFGKRDPNHQMDARGYISLAGIFILMPVGLYFGMKHLYGVKSERAKQRYDALVQLSARIPELKHAHHAKITGPSVGRIPWLASEMDTVVECDLHGDYRGHRLALFECTYVIDTTLTTLDSSFGGMASTVMSHIDHGHIHRWSLEAVVFLDPVLALPDAFSAEKKQPLNWYFKRQLQKNEIADVKPLPGDRWVVTSDPTQWAWSVQARPDALLQARPDTIVQVMGGHVVVITKTWNCNLPKEKPHEEAEIEQNLAWACQVYDSLRGTAAGGPAPRVATAAVTRTAPEAGAAAVSPARAQQSPAEMAPAFVRPPVKPRTVLQIVLGVVGFLLFGVGCLFLLGLMILNSHVSGAAQWPTVEGRVVSAKVDERSGPSYSANIKYTFEVGGKRYEGDKRTLVATEWLDDRAEIDGAVAKYKVGEAVKVYHHPRNHHEACLEPRVTDNGMGTCVGVFSGLFAVIGMGLMYVGIRRPK